METVDCTWPFSSNKEKICENVEDAKIAYEIGMKHYRKKSNDCLDPCNFLKIDSNELGVFSSLNPEISFKFPEFIRITRAYYSYTRINLIAEIGGYVGLFLGISVYQFTNIIDKIYSIITNMVETRGSVTKVESLR